MTHLMREVTAVIPAQRRTAEDWPVPQPATRPARFDGVWFTAQFQEYRGYLTQFVASRVPESAVADIVSETFARAWKAVAEGRYEQMGVPFRAYLSTIARNLCIDRARHDKCLTMVPLVTDEYDADFGHDHADPGACVEELAEARVLLADLLTLVRALPPNQAESIVLRYVAGLSTSQTAAHLGTNPGVVKARIVRAMAHLRPAVATWGAR